MNFYSGDPETFNVSNVGRTCDVAQPSNLLVFAARSLVCASISTILRERASHLLHFRELGDTKPSVLMDDMLALLGDHTPCFLFQQLFLQCLPEDIRVQLVDSKADDYRHLAKKADALWAS